MTIELDVGGGRFALVDDEDMELIAGFRWRAHWHENPRTYYVHGTQPGGAGTTYLHRLVAGLRKGDARQVHHRDFNGLNNTRSNLSVCSRSENQANRRMGSDNTSGFKGVSLDPRRNTWNAECTFAGVRRRKSGFRVAEDAARWYDAQALALHGEYAVTNHSLGRL